MCGTKHVKCVCWPQQAEDPRPHPELTICSIHLRHACGMKRVCSVKHPRSNPELTICLSRKPTNPSTRHCSEVKPLTTAVASRCFFVASVCLILWEGEVWGEVHCSAVCGSLWLPDLHPAISGRTSVFCWPCPALHCVHV